MDILKIYLKKKILCKNKVINTGVEKLTGLRLKKLSYYLNDTFMLIMMMNLLKNWLIIF